MTISPVVLLSLAVCGALSWENVPSIPAGRRAEYYLLQDDGGYKYGYDTGEGQSALVNADPSNQVQGQYEYVDNSGRRVSLSYTAGEQGFVPQLLGGSAAASGIPSSYQSSAGIPSSYQSSAEGSADYDNNADASYSFTIDTDSYKRTETADAKGNVRGQYSYTSKEGGNQAVSYIAGEGTGFVANSNVGALPVNNAYIPPASTLYSAAPVPSNAYIPPAAAPYPAAPASNVVSKINDDGSYSFSFNTGDQSREESADANNNVKGSYSFKSKDDGQTRRVDYTSGAAIGYVAQGAHLPVPPTPSAFGFSTPTSSLGYPSSLSSAPPSAVSPYSSAGPQADGSYSFSYDAGDHSRQETGDAQNNVRGTFSFKAKDDGQTRRVDYEAGAATGFVANGAHLPGASGLGVQPPTYSSPDVSGRYDSQEVTVNSYSGSSSNEETTSGDASYSFSYNTGDQSRQESSDALGNVQGQFSFVGKDGVNRKVEYTAGSEKGFIAKGAHLPSAQAVPTGYATASSFGQYSNPPTNFGVATTPYSGTGSTSYSGAGSSSGLQKDGSYSFSYDAGDHSHQQSGNAQNKVRGSFSFKAKDDGLTRRVDYEAGADTGFVAKGDHLPVAPPVSGYTPSSASTSYQANPKYADLSLNSQADAPSGDGSYSYSYKTDSSSKHETADSQGNVMGSFSYVGGDGMSRSVQYTSRGEEGFIASGAHLPKAGNGLASESIAGLGLSGTRASHAKPEVSDFTLQKYLPPESPKKFGYIFDTKA